VAKILLVDDNAELVASAERFLGQRGYAIATSTSSMGVSQLVRSERPDIVVLDVMMPDVGGDALTPFLQKMTAMQDVPIVLYSAMDDEKLHQLARQHGVHYVSKTDGLPTLHDTIRRLLAR
jgi:CheY-like chemotaxis protein